jgi:uncharacterized protein with PIN domain
MSAPRVSDLHDGARSCEFRFYEELNDYLPRGLRGRAFTRAVSGTPSVKDAIEAIGVPHTEIDVILVDGRSVRFNHRVRGGERIAVYPVCKRFDIAPLHRLRPKPLSNPRFVVDVHLGTLARYLRLLGFDAMYRNDLTDPELARLAAQQRRILLTCDVGLLKRKTVRRGHWLRARDPERQIEEVATALQLRRLIRPFTRCLACNQRLAPLDRRDARDRVAARVYRRFRRFVRCGGCGRVYWQGTHFQRLQRLVSRVRAETVRKGPRRPYAAIPFPVSSPRSARRG